MSDRPGYHIASIKKGDLGRISKIQEELDELKDAEDQNCKIMMLLELSDLYGAIVYYLEENFPDMQMEDLEKMSYITGRAFLNGERK